MERSDAHRPPTALAATLHQDARFLRALARSLLHDDAAADDVVQEALVTALRRPPRADGSLRGWLAGIVRHLSFRRRRSEQRRAHHESAAASVVVLEGPESPAAIVARGELLQLLVNAVMELPAAQRDAVLLRYFEGLTAAEIARRRGLPDATVRSHLKRALDALRARLDARNRGGRAEWIALLAPWAESSGPSDLSPPAAGSPAAPVERSRPSSPLPVAASGSSTAWRLAGTLLLLSSGPPCSGTRRGAVAHRNSHRPNSLRSMRLRCRPPRSPSRSIRFRNAPRL